MFRAIILTAAFFCALLSGCASETVAPPARSPAASAGTTLPDPLKEAAERGKAEAQFQLANAYERGAGRAQSYAEAFVWYAKAAAQGHAPSQFYLGAMYASSRAPQGLNLEEAVRWYGLSAAQGYVDALFPMAYANEFGIGTPKDHAQAVLWYQRSASAGVSYAMDRLAKAYRLGELGLDPDRERAEDWTRKADAARKGQKEIAVPYTK